MNSMMVTMIMIKKVMLKYEARLTKFGLCAFCCLDVGSTKKQQDCWGSSSSLTFIPLETVPLPLFVAYKCMRIWGAHTSGSLLCYQLQDSDYSSLLHWPGASLQACRYSSTSDISHCCAFNLSVCPLQLVSLGFYIGLYVYHSAEEGEMKSIESYNEKVMLLPGFQPASHLVMNNKKSVQTISNNSVWYYNSAEWKWGRVKFGSSPTIQFIWSLGFLMGSPFCSDLHFSPPPHLFQSGCIENFFSIWAFSEAKDDKIFLFLRHYCVFDCHCGANIFFGGVSKTSLILCMCVRLPWFCTLQYISMHL